MRAASVVASATIGFPRIGPRREVKAALEAFWRETKGAQSTPAASARKLWAAVASAEAAALTTQSNAGVAHIGVDTTLYDPVLDTILWLGLAPPRFDRFAHDPLGRYFAMARGADGCEALDMSKWFDTNYHYLQPELAADACPPAAVGTWPVDALKRATAVLKGTASSAVPILIGPVTFVACASARAHGGGGAAGGGACCSPGATCSAAAAKTAEQDEVEAKRIAAMIASLVPSYAAMLHALASAGAVEVQMHEPALAGDGGRVASLKAATVAAYAFLAAYPDLPPLNLVIPYDDVPPDAYPWVSSLPVACLTLAFCGVPGCADPPQSLDLITRLGFPHASKRLGAGVVDGRSVWGDAACPPGRAAADILASLVGSCGIPRDRITVSTSCSLHHLPYDVAAEADHLGGDLMAKLAFAKQKAEQLGSLAAALAAGTLPAPSSGEAPHKVAAGAPQGVDAAMLVRAAPYDARRPTQIFADKSFAFPTSTIGSFPQTAGVRKLRAKMLSGELSKEQYEAGIDAEIAYAIGLQEGLGLHVLVHGESERTDMVEFFGAQLDGFAFTTAGWSYGSRCVRPPIIVGDVRPRPGKEAMTIREFSVAQARTAKPVKGMLTGPVTILNWSFPRKDVPRSVQALQIAACVREEIARLEAVGCRVVQVDEPALREGLPLKHVRWDGYLRWATDAFRLATAGTFPHVQLVTHLCYSSFEDILPAIDALDADVLTIENGAPTEVYRDAMLKALAEYGYARDVGAGVFDVHSPVVPSAEGMATKLLSAVSAGLLASTPGRLWAVPDCGLKTRSWEEVIPSLRNMASAAAQAREKLAAKSA